MRYLTYTHVKVNLYRLVYVYVYTLYPIYMYILYIYLYSVDIKNSYKSITKANSLTQKWKKDLSRHFKKGNTQMANKDRKTTSLPWYLSKTQNLYLITRK